MQAKHFVFVATLALAASAHAQLLGGGGALGGALGGSIGGGGSFSHMGGIERIARAPATATRAAPAAEPARASAPAASPTPATSPTVTPPASASSSAA
jgi:hypothetical protein